jgi:hypothetical protein
MVGKLTRNDQLSASRICVLANASPYQTPNQLLAEMIGIDNGDTPTKLEQNDAMLFGDLSEPMILKAAAERLQLKDLRLEFPSAFEHPTLPFAASLDGTAIGNRAWSADPSKGIYTPQGTAMVDLTGQGVLEAKLTASPPETVPAPFRGAPWQLQSQLMCTGLKWGVVAVLYTSPITLRLFLYQADPAIQQRITSMIQDFEERRKDNRPYPVLSRDDGAAAYGRSNPDHPPVELASEEARQYLEQLVIARRNKKIADEEIDEASAAIMEIMGEAEVAVGMVGNSQYQVKWPTRKTRAQPERIVAAKPASEIRQKTLTIKEIY